MTRLLQSISLRTKFTISMFIIVICSTAIPTFIGFKILTRTMLEEENKQLRQNLRSAAMVYSFRRDTIRQSIQGAAKSERLARTLEPERKEMLPNLLARIREEHRLHFLTFVDTRNPRMLRALLSDFSQPDSNPFPIMNYLKHALTGKIMTGTEMLPRESLRRESLILAEQARIPILSKTASENAPLEIDSGLAMISAAPVETRTGFKGVLYGGVLLNQDLRLVTQIDDFVFGARDPDKKPNGIISFYLRNTCIATNSMPPDGGSDIGARIDPEIERTVLSQGKTYYGGTKKNGDWHLLACQPLRNHQNIVVGILNVGISETPLHDAHAAIMTAFFLVACIGMIVALGISFILTHKFNRPRIRKS